MELLTDPPLTKDQKNLAPDLSDVLDINSFVDKYPQFSIEQIRWAITRRKTNGLEQTESIFKMGKRWYLNVPVFTEWMMFGQNNPNY